MADQPLWKGQQAPVQRADGSTEQPAGPGPGRGRKLVVAAFAVVALVALVAAVRVLGTDDTEEPVSVADLAAGECLSSPDLATAEANVAIGSLQVIDCESGHDAEVFAVREFGPGDDLDAATEQCVLALDGTGRTLATLEAAGLQVLPLAEAHGEGDAFACLVRRADGAAMAGRQFGSP